VASDLSSVSDFSVSFNISATSCSHFCMHCGQQVDAATAAGSTFSEARLSGVIVVVGKVFNGDKDSSVVPRIPLVPSLVLQETKS
jgi:hypothetical protein